MSVATDWQIEVFYDGDCPLCDAEIRMLRRMNRRGRIRFTDIADERFSPADHGMTMDDFMDEIRGRLPDGTWVVGVEVFRRLYAAARLGPIGFGPLVWVTRWPGVSHLMEFGYRIFAKNRLRLTGRCGVDGSCKTD